MLELYIIRHGLAGKGMANGALDEARPLTKKGKDRMKDISKGLNRLGIRFDAIVTSPLLRAKETADIVLKYCGGPEELTLSDILKPGASYDELIGYLNGLKGKDKVAIVGHEPFLSGFASYCLSKSKSSFINLKKGGVIMIELDGALKPGKCMLAWQMEPGQIIEFS